MNAFQYRGGQLHCEGVSLRRLAEEFGTPLYVYSQGHVVGQYQDLDRAFAGIDHLICCSVKANGNLALLRAVAKAGAGFDVVSGGELYRVLRAEGDPTRCVFAGVGKTRDEIEYALKLGIYCFNVESEPELQMLAAVARRMGRRAPIAIRVNPGVDPETHRYISTGKHESKFGISISRALDVYRGAAQLRSIEIRGVQMHIGSQITKTGPFVLAMRKIAPLLERVRELAPRTLEFFDVGGGLGIRYRDERPPTATGFARAALPHLRRTGLRILLEPGRFLFGNGGVLVARVLYVKQTPVKRFVIIDAAMNDLIRPALYESYHEIVPVAERSARRRMIADVVGPVCESGDFFARDRKVAAVGEGEWLAVMSAGAYGMAMASNYNARPRPAEVLVNGRRYELVRRRESVKDLIAGETIPSWLV
ncbi:MAG TPA: diaminopimelate decarboxylase [Verrucomicrobiae bacterium]|nr:diaminopimelate decarboxylase [Verrucomicrobiae bacterium]